MSQTHIAVVQTKPDRVRQPEKVTPTRQHAHGSTQAALQLAVDLHSHVNHDRARSAVLLALQRTTGNRSVHHLLQRADGVAAHLHNFRACTGQVRRQKRPASLSKTPDVQTDRRSGRSGYKEVVITVRWLDDSVDMFHRIVETASRTGAFRGIDTACFWVPFNDPSKRFFHRHSGRHLSDLRVGDRVQIHVGGYYDPEGVPCLSQVRIWHDEDVPAPPPPSPQTTSPAPAQPPRQTLTERGLIRWDVQDTPERVYIIGSGVTPRLIAEDFYGDGSKATHVRAFWNDQERGAPFTVDTVLPTNGFFVVIEYSSLLPEFQREYDSNPLVITRDIWGARPPITNDPNREYEPYTGKLEDIYDSIAIHHAGNEGYRTMNEIQDLHMDDMDRADVGYHYGISLRGNVYEGRPIGVRGAHIEGGNTGKIGIVLMADLDTGYLDDDDELTPAMEASLLRLIHSLLGRYPNIQYLGGHKEYNSARTCPGDLGMARMDAWRSSTRLSKPTPVN